MVKIFCAHVEVFLRVIAEVSSDTIGHTDRTNELEKKFNTNNKSYDILDKDIQKSGDNVGWHEGTNTGKCEGIQDG